MTSTQVVDLWWEGDDLVVETADGDVVVFENAYFTSYDARHHSPEAHVHVTQQEISWQRGGLEE